MTTRRSLFRSAIAAVAFAAMDTMGLRPVEVPKFDPYDVAYLQQLMRNLEENLADAWDDKPRFNYMGNGRWEECS